MASVQPLLLPEQGKTRMTPNPQILQYIEEHHYLYLSPNVFMMNKSRRMLYAVHVAHVGDIRNAYIILVGKSKGKSWV